MTLARLVAATLVAGLLGACSSEEPTQPASYSVLITGGTVYDGSLAEPRVTAIGIVDDRIVTMDAPADAQADRVIDATGRVVVPGFIDPHTHAGEDLMSAERNANINFLTQGVTTVFIGNDGRGLADLPNDLATMREQGIGSNVAFFTGHGTARDTVIGLEARAPTDDELEAMRAFTESEMEAGAIGLSSGLFYRPGSYAETAEVVELAKVAARFGGVYDTHLRDESSYSIGLQGAVREAVQIAEEADIPAHIAHLKALGRDVWGQSGDVIGIIAAARERGLSVTADQYPWRASGTSLGSALVPRWVQADSQEAMLERLANADLEDRIHEEMEANLWRRGGDDSLLITGESQWRGMTLKEIAAELELGAIDAAIEVVRSGDPSVASFNMNPDDMDALAIQPWVMTGSDGSGGHPRKFASYPKAYVDMVVTKSLFPMQRFVHRSSGQVADTFSLCDRGYLRPGLKADIAVLDLDEFKPMADFQNPTVLSTGVDYLLVNGNLAIDAGTYTGALAGSIVHRQNLSCPD